MATSEHDDKPESRPLDAEREKLRKAGYNDTEISQILVARALGTSGPAADATSSQGVLSGAISSIVAIGSYARGTIFTIRNDLATIFDRTAVASARVGAAAILAFKVAVISVLAFAGWQEWKQHIIYAPDTSGVQLGKITSEACSARVKAFLDSATRDELLKGNAELARDCGSTYADSRRGAINAAEIAAAQADKAKAEACNARMQQLTQNMYMDDFNADGSTVKAGSRTARMIEQYNKDCDPTAATRADSAIGGAVQGYQGIKKMAKESNPKFDDQDASIQSSCLFGVRTSTGLQLGDQSSTGMVGDSLPICSGAAIAYKLGTLAHIAFDSPHDLSKATDEATKNVWNSQDVAADIMQCMDGRQNYAGLLSCSCVAGARFGAAKAIPLGDERAKESLMQRSNTVCQRLTAKFAELDGPDAIKKYQEFVWLAELTKIDQAKKAGDHATAYKISQQYEAEVEADEVKETGKPGKRSAGALANLSWHAILARKFPEALAAADRSITLDPSDRLVPETNRAHALMMLGRTAEAKAAYLANKGKPLQGKTWELVIADDFATLRKAGIESPLMPEIDAALNPPTPSATPTENNLYDLDGKPCREGQRNCLVCPRGNMQLCL